MTRASNDPILSPQGATWESAGTINPAVVFHNEKFIMLYRAQDVSGTSRLGYAESIDGLHFTRRPEPVLFPEAPYEVDGGVEDRGIVLIYIYNGADDSLVYRAAVAVFDRKDPRKLLYRSDAPIFSPEKEWEKVGQVPNVVFIEGFVLKGNRYFFYYGAADKFIGIAEAPIARSE